MAAIMIKPEKIGRNTLQVLEVSKFSAVDPADGAALPMGNDGRLLILLQNSGGSAVTATVVKGNALQGAAQDLTMEIPGYSYAVAAVESGLYGNVSGPYRGMILVKGSTAALKAAVYTMPE